MNRQATSSAQHLLTSSPSCYSHREAGGGVKCYFEQQQVCGWKYSILYNTPFYPQSTLSWWLRSDQEGRTNLDIIARKLNNLQLTVISDLSSHTHTHTHSYIYTLTCTHTHTIWFYFCTLFIGILYLLIYLTKAHYTPLWVSILTR